MRKGLVLIVAILGGLAAGYFFIEGYLDRLWLAIRDYSASYMPSVTFVLNVAIGLVGLGLAVVLVVLMFWSVRTRATRRKTARSVTRDQEEPRDEPPLVSPERDLFPDFDVKTDYSLPEAYRPSLRVVWGVTHSAMVSRKEYCRIVSGIVLRGFEPVSGAQVTTQTITDYGVETTKREGVTVTTGSDGGFILDLRDTTVPVEILARELWILVKDGGFLEIVTIERPVDTRFPEGQTSERPRQILPGADVQKTPAPRLLPALARFLALAFTVLILVGIAQHWTPVWVITPLLAILSALAIGPAKSGRLWPRKRWKLMAPVSFLWIGLWLAAMFAG